MPTNAPDSAAAPEPDTAPEPPAAAQGAPDEAPALAPADAATRDAGTRPADPRRARLRKEIRDGMRRALKH